MPESEAFHEAFDQPVKPNPNRRPGHMFVLGERVRRSHDKPDYLLFPVPLGADGIVLCVQTREGLQPVRILLPTQTTDATIRVLLRDFPGLDAIIAIPYRAADYVTVAYQARVFES